MGGRQAGHGEDCGRAGSARGVPAALEVRAGRADRCLDRGLGGGGRAAAPRAPGRPLRALHRREEPAHPGLAGRSRCRTALRRAPGDRVGHGACSAGRAVPTSGMGTVPRSPLWERRGVSLHISKISPLSQESSSPAVLPVPKPALLKKVCGWAPSIPTALRWPNPVWGQPGRGAGQDAGQDASRVAFPWLLAPVPVRDSNLGFTTLCRRYQVLLPAPQVASPRASVGPQAEHAPGRRLVRTLVLE